MAEYGLHEPRCKPRTPKLGDQRYYKIHQKMDTGAYPCLLFVVPDQWMPVLAQAVAPSKTAWRALGGSMPVASSVVMIKQRWQQHVQPMRAVRDLAQNPDTRCWYTPLPQQKQYLQARGLIPRRLSCIKVHSVILVSGTRGSPGLCSYSRCLNITRKAHQYNVENYLHLSTAIT